jgi:hypothetical protein
MYEFSTISGRVIEATGVYPLLTNDTCNFGCAAASLSGGGLRRCDSGARTPNALRSLAVNWACPWPWSVLAMPDRLLARTGLVDGVERQRDFDQRFFWGSWRQVHRSAPSNSLSPARTNAMSAGASLPSLAAHQPVVEGEEFEAHQRRARAIRRLSGQSKRAVQRARAALPCDGDHRHH